MITPSVVPPAQGDGLATDFAGRRWPLFRMAAVMGLWTVLTLGLYRFWMKTRLRRYYWSAVRPGGLPLEYTGDPLEKLLGFLLVVVLLAFYLGIANLTLMFLSLRLFAFPAGAVAVSALVVLPLFFYARYRARRYVLARTRWRGIRFGLAPGAWGYAGRALLYWLLTLLTLGVLWPLMTYRLEAYRTDRTWFGNWKLEQGGHWRMLYAPWRHVVIGLLICAVAVDNLPVYGFWLIAGVPWTLYGLAFRRVETLRLLTETKRAGTLRLRFRPRVWRVLRIYAVFGLVLFAWVIALGLAIMGVSFRMVGEVWAEPADIIRILLGEHVWIAAALTLAVYTLLSLIFAVLLHMLLTLPLWRHYAEVLEIEGAGHLPELRQRERDAFVEAEGFAEALDIGGAI